LTPGGPIEKRWRELKCDEKLGFPISPERPHLGSGGIYQDFEKGQIVVHPRWAGDPTATMANYLMSAHVEGDKIHVFWGDTAPYSYDFFNIRWDRDDHEESIEAQHEPKGGFLGIGSSDPQQVEVEGNKTNGSENIETNGDGTYIISVEGCNDGGLFSGSDCKQGWSYPVEVDVGLITLPKPAALPLPPTLLSPTSPPFDLPDGPIVAPPQAELIVEKECSNPHDIIESDGDHKGELKTNVALAVLQAIRDPYPPPNKVNCGNPPL
jgi:hypothetical protein